MNILEVSGLTVRYGEGGHALTAVDAVDLAIPKGGTLGLVGESGCGKSTVAKALVALAPVAAGSIALEGSDWSSVSARTSPRYRRRVQLVFQDPYSSLNPRMAVGEMLQEALAMRERRREGRPAAEVRRLLGLVGLPETAVARYPHQFSGGQRQRIAIARALAVDPIVLVLDEVTSALDVSVQATVLNLLRELQHELGLSYLFISHDLSVVRLMSDEIAVMYLGRVVERAPNEAFFAGAAHPYSRALIASIPTLRAAERPAALPGDLPDPRQPPAGCRFHTRCPVGPLARPERTVCREVEPGLEPAGSPHRAACHFAEVTT